MQIQFVNLQRQNKIYRKEIIKVISGVVKEAKFVMGPELTKFEKSFAKFCGKKYAVGMNSGTDALKIALLAYGVREGDEVITVANSYFSTAMVIAEIGAVPVLVDAYPDTLTIDVNAIERAITKKTKAIIPVHLYGQSADMDGILRLAKKHNIVVIEDACQAHGAMHKGRVVPIGETGAFSFYPGKNLGGFGDGGALVTDSKKIYETCLYLRNDGSLEKYFHNMIGIKSRLDTLQAAILQFKLRHLDEWNKRRRQVARMYDEKLKNINGIEFIDVGRDNYHVYHLYVIRCNKRDELQRYLKKSGIQTVIHYPLPIHLQKGFKKFGYKKGDFPVSEKASETVISLPMFPEIKDSEINYVCSVLDRFFRKSPK